MTDSDRERRERWAQDRAAQFPGHPAGSWEDLCLFLGASSSSFTGQLLALAAKADPGNLTALRGAFPFEIRAWETWRDHSPATWGDLAELLKAEDDGYKCSGRAEGRHDLICEHVLCGAFGSVADAPEDVKQLLREAGRLPGTTGEAR